MFSLSVLKLCTWYQYILRYLGGIIQCLGFALDILAEREKTEKEEEEKVTEGMDKKERQMSVITEAGDGPRVFTTVLSVFVHP